GPSRGLTSPDSTDISRRRWDRRPTPWGRDHARHPAATSSPCSPSSWPGAPRPPDEQPDPRRQRDGERDDHDAGEAGRTDHGGDPALEDQVREAGDEDHPPARADGGGVLRPGGRGWAGG